MRMAAAEREGAREREVLRAMGRLGAEVELEDVAGESVDDVHGDEEFSFYDDDLQIALRQM